MEIQTSKYVSFLPMQICKIVISLMFLFGKHIICGMDLCVMYTQIPLLVWSNLWCKGLLAVLHSKYCGKWVYIDCTIYCVCLNSPLHLCFVDWCNKQLVKRFSLSLVFCVITIRVSLSCFKPVEVICVLNLL